MKKAIIFFLVSLVFVEKYTKFLYIIEAEDCEGVGEAWTSVFEKKIKGMFT
jgi:hypothetical protein